MFYLPKARINKILFTLNNYPNKRESSKEEWLNILTWLVIGGISFWRFMG